MFCRVVAWRAVLCNRVWRLADATVCGDRLMQPRGSEIESSAYQQFGLQGTSFGTLKHIHIVALLEDEELIRSALAQLPTKLPCRTAAEILAPWGYAHKKPGKGLCLVPIAIQL